MTDQPHVYVCQICKRRYESTIRLTYPPQCSGGQHHRQVNMVPVVTKQGAST